jgi:hypothetical protein
LFGENKYKLKAPSFAFCDRTGMENIYWRVFGTSTITNNEMPLWIVRGYIAQKNKLKSNGQR